MAKEQEQNQNQNEELEQEVAQAAPVQKKSKFNPKVIVIGLPVFIIQLIAVYFITANILLKKMDARDSDNTEISSQLAEVADATNGVSADTNIGEHIFLIEDIIVNPARTTGNQLLLSSVAFDVPEEEYYKELEKKQILVRDLVISVLSSKTVAQLANSLYKDTLRTEISSKVQSMIGNVEINRVYFSKYIIN